MQHDEKLEESEAPILLYVRITSRCLQALCPRGAPLNAGLHLIRYAMCQRPVGNSEGRNMTQLERTWTVWYATHNLILSHK